MVAVKLVIAAVILTLFIRMTLRFWDRHELVGSQFDRRQFVLWAAKGLGVPLLLWMLLNAGFSQRYPPLLAAIEAAKSSRGPWITAWLGLLLPAAFVVSSYWAAATFIWMIAIEAVGLEYRLRDFLGAFIPWGVLFSPVIALMLYIGGPGAAGLAATILLAPVVHEQLLFATPRIRHPMYDHAIEKIKAGKYTAAEREVIRQLQKCDSDFAGWMMLAELYSNHFNDLPEADRLVHELCRQTEITREQMCQALHRLADWHLERAGDRAAAVSVLEEICQAFPATHYGDVARKRRDQILLGKI